MRVLRALRIPSPSFFTVKNTGDIPDLSCVSATNGWTIRTCRYSGINEFGLFSRNYLTGPVARSTLESRLAIQRDEFYIVYPSWTFEMAINIAVSHHIAMVDVVCGFPDGLSMGRRVPDFSYIVPFGFVTQARVVKGSRDSQVLRRVAQVLYFSRRVPWPNFYVEVALTTDRCMKFYELRPI